MKPELFRKASLEKLSSPDQLDLFATFASPRGWLALLGLGCVIIAAVLWGIIGALPAKVQGQGILVSQGGVAAVVCGVDGQFTDIKVAPGDIVREGEVVARVFHPDWKRDTGENMTEEAMARRREKITRDSQVVSPYSGRVLEVVVNRGEWGKPGTPVLHLELTGKDMKALEAVLYVPLEEGKKISPGMEVQVSPTVIRREEYGFMSGRVTSVSDFPATREGMMKLLGSTELVEKLLGQGASVEVHVDLTPDTGTVSGFKWSSRGGPPVKIESGTLCRGDIIIDTARPVELAVPVNKPD